MKNILFTSLIVSTLLLSNLNANDAKKNEFVSHAEFGFINTSGNTDTTAYNLDLKVKKSLDQHHFNFLADLQYSDDQGVEINNKFLTELQYNYDITDKLAFDYLIGYKEDKFSGYNYQAYTGPGVKYKVIEDKKHNLTLEGNILYSTDELELPKETNDYTSLRAKAVYTWQILENLKLTQDLSYRVETQEADNYFVYSKTAFISKISDIFSFGISYKIDYVNTPPALVENSNKTLTANLIFDY